MAVFFFLLLPILSFLIALSSQIDFYFGWRLLNGNLLEATAIIMREYRIVWGDGLKTLFLIVALGAPFALRRLEQRNSKTYNRCLAAVLVAYAAMGIASVYLFYLQPDFFAVSNQSFWASLKRYGGIFSDPNALGLVAAMQLILLGDLIWQRGSCSAIRSQLLDAAILLVAGIWILLGFLSGSRTFFLIVGITLLLLAIMNRNRKILLLGSALTITVLGVVYLCFPEAPLLSGLHRAIETFQLSKMMDQLQSRIIFFTVNTKLFLSHPFFGVGFNRFSQFFQSSAAAAGYTLGSWNDGPNSFYLSILSELGVSALILFIFLIRSVVFKPIDRPAVAGGYAFLVALLFGNHFDFPEVSVLAAFLFSFMIAETVPITRWQSLISILIVCIFASHLTVSEISQPRGFYRDSTGAMLIRRQAQLRLACGTVYTVDAPWITPDKASLVVTIPQYVPNPINFHRATDSVEVSMPPCENQGDTFLVSIDCSRFYIPEGAVKRPYCVRLR